jgi:hypothetical protein
VDPEQQGSETPCLIRILKLEVMDPDPEQDFNLSKRPKKNKKFYDNDHYVEVKLSFPHKVCKLKLLKGRKNICYGGRVDPKAKLFESRIWIQNSLKVVSGSETNSFESATLLVHPN